MPARTILGTGQTRERAVTTLLGGDETGGRLALLELRASAGRGVPRHVHDHEDEIVYVVEGTLTFCVGDEATVAKAGSCFVLPGGVEHGYAVASGEARLLVWRSPAGVGASFEEEVAEHGELEVARLIAIAAGCGVAITGPAPTVHGPGP